MGYVVCHIQKPKGNDAGTSAHIERKVHSANADQSQEYLNQKLVEYPDGVENRTQAIQHRIETTGITRKIGTNQVRALRVVLSGSPEDMRRIVAEGRLDEWCEDNMRWLRETFGKENVVSADLHRDEKTPHIHATVVPIVSGERRKVAEKSAKTAAPAKTGKKKYRKKPANTVRLCADDVMTRKNLERFQDTYAEAMAKYGLERGIRGSDARHINTPQYYRDLYAKSEDLREDIAQMEEEKQEVRADIRYLYDQKDKAQGKFNLLDDYYRKRQKEIEKQEALAHARAEQVAAEKQQAETELQKVKGEINTGKLKSTAVEAGTKFMDGVGSLFGSSKIERQQQEIETLKADKAGLTMQLGNKDVQIRNLQRDHQSDIERLKQSHDRDMAAKQAELDRIAVWFPDIPQLVETADHCREVGFSREQTRELVVFRPVQYTGKLRSPKSGRAYDADNVTARIERRATTPGFTLTINGISILQWFKQQFEKLGNVIR